MKPNSWVSIHHKGLIGVNNQLSVFNLQYTKILTSKTLIFHYDKFATYFIYSQNRYNILKTPEAGTDLLVA